MNSINFPNMEQVDEMAAAWVARIDRGLSVKEEDDLSSWLEESPVNGEALVKCASMWDLLDVLSPIAKLMPIESLELQERSVVRESKFGQKAGFIPWGIAATLMIATWFFGGDNFNSPVSDTATPVAVESSDQTSIVSGVVYRTAVGEMSQVTLDDGSKLQLNTDSEVRVDFSASTRQLELISGEVFFDVAKDPSKPFVVNVGDDQVTAVGTAFNIDALVGGDTEVLVTEGKVKVNHNSDGKVSAYQELFLTPGQSVKIIGNTPEIKEDLDPEALLSWRQGVLVFQGESLAEAIKEIDRYTPLSFTIMDEEVANVSVGGFFKAGDTEQLLLILKQNFGVSSTRIGDEILLHSSK